MYEQAISIYAAQMQEDTQVRLIDIFKEITSNVHLDS